MPKLSNWFSRVKSKLTNSSKSRPRSTTWSVHTSNSTASSTSRSSEDDYPSLPNVKKVDPTKQVLEEEQYLTGITSRWDNAVVVVVGASAGIGSAICICLVKRGFTVIGCSKTSELLNALAEECTERNFKGKLYAYKSELLYENDVKDLFAWVYKKFGRIDVLVNNPDLIYESSLTKLPLETLRQVVQRRVVTLILSTKEAAKYMMKQKDGRGHIFNICSTIDVIATEYARIMSSSSPSTQRVGRGLKLHTIEKSRIVVSAISPGKSEAELFRILYGDDYVKLSPLSNGSYFSPQEVANTLLYSLAKV